MNLLKQKTTILFVLAIMDYAFIKAQCTPFKGSAPHDSLFNTGTNGNGGVLSGGSNDRNWTFATGFINGTYQPAIVMGYPPSTYYNSPWSSCTWISQSSTGSHSNSIEQFYKIKFDLPCFDLCGRSFDSAGTFCLTFDVLVDNSIHEIYVNGKSQSSRLSGFPVGNPYYHRGFEESGMISFSLCNDWKAGQNELIFHIRSAPSHVGFLAQASVKLADNGPITFVKDTIKRTICDKEKVNFGDSTYNKTGIYYRSYNKMNACDTLQALDLRVNKNKFTTIYDTICRGDSSHGKSLGGIYIDTFITQSSCDSIRHLYLTVNEPSSSYIKKLLYDGDSFEGYSETGIYSDTFVNSLGCDSIRVIELYKCSYHDIEIYAPDTVCSAQDSIILKSLNNDGANGSWSGTFVRDSIFYVNQVPDINNFYGPYTIHYKYTDPLNQCETIDSMYIIVQNQEELQLITVSPLSICDNMEAELECTSKYSGNILWKSKGDGLFSDSTGLKTLYYPGLTDSINRNVLLELSNLNSGVCQPQSLPLLLNIEKTPYFKLPEHFEVCEPAEIDFSLTFSDYSDNYRFNWDFGNGETIVNTDDTAPSNIKYPVSTQNGYNVKITAFNRWGNGPQDVCIYNLDSMAYVRVHPVPEADFTTDPQFRSTVAFTKFRMINNSRISFGPVYYKWDFGESGNSDTSSIENPVHIYPPDTGDFTIGLMAFYRYYYRSKFHYCSDSIFKTVYIGPDVTVFIPNAINPESGIPHNAGFFPVVNGEKHFEMQIFNRWGEIIFQTNDKTKGWNGTYKNEICQQDVYVFLIKVTGFNDIVYEYKGTLTLLR